MELYKIMAIILVLLIASIPIFYYVLSFIKAAIDIDNIEKYGGKYGKRKR